MSAYFLWMNENREQIKKDYPGLTIAEFGKKAGELWKNLSDKSVSSYFVCDIVKLTQIRKSQEILISFKLIK